MTEGTVAAARRIIQQAGNAGGSPLKTALLSSFTIEPLNVFLEAALIRFGYAANAVYVGPFNQFRQELLMPSSAYYKQGADATFLFMQLEDLVPGEKNAAALQQFDEAVKALFAQFTAQSGKILIVADFILPVFAPAGPFSGINQRLREIVSGFPGVHVFDLDGFASYHGKNRVVDPKMFYMARMALAPSVLHDLSVQLAGFLAAIQGKTKKVLVLDLDNTLWGGVLGEEGFERIQVGDEYPGNVYLDRQRLFRRLKDKGVLLAVNSKNNPREVERVLNEHPAMLLKKKDFASIQANWSDKASNLLKIAEELNVGLDSLVFLDDSPSERAFIRAALPEVTVPEPPDEPAAWRSFIEQLPYFGQARFTAEDAKRTELYEQEARRKQLKDTVPSISDFLAGLEMEMETGRMGEFELPRVSQLTLKTNQFNLTTRRYTEPELKKMTADGFAVHWAKLKDKFGDMGLIAVAIVDMKGPEAGSCRLDSFLMSCRAIGREAELAFMAHILEGLKQKGTKSVYAEFIPTERNEIAASFLQSVGFKPAQKGGHRFELSSTPIRSSAHLSCREAVHGR